MKRILIVLSALAVAACHDTANDTEPDNTPNLRTLSAAEVQVSAGTNDFAFSLYKKVQDADPHANTFISPLSVSMALAMTLNGASDETQQSILNTIDYGDLTAAEVNQAYKDLTALLLSMDKKVAMGIANSVWYRNSLTVFPAFSNTINEYYDGTVEGLNFDDPGSKNTINRWVEDKTNDRIKNLVETINPEDVMFLINAIYFKGDWTYKFDKLKTSSRQFTREDGSTTPVDMMNASKVAMKIHHDSLAHLIDLPYGNEQFRFTILLPKDSHTVAEVAAALNTETLNTWLTDAADASSEFELPKFKMEWKKDLKETLASMGMSTIGFLRLFEDLPQDLEITSVTHKSFLEVNESGTEAAAVTSVGVGTTSTVPQPITINRPFIFMIRENHTGAILFMGQLTDPAAL